MSASVELARRAVACKLWRWMPGMRDRDGRVLVHFPNGTLGPESRFVSTSESMVASAYTWPIVDDRKPTPLPDLDDPATLGGIEHGLLPAEGFNDAHIDAAADRDGTVIYFVVYRPDPVSFPTKWLSAVDEASYSKAEALVAALEAAP